MDITNNNVQSETPLPLITHGAYGKTWREIEQWLQSLGPLPLFQRTPQALDELSQLKRLNESANQVMLGIIKAHTLIYQRNTTQVLHLDEIVNQLPLKNSIALKTLASIASILKLDNFNLSSFQTAIARATIDSMEAQREKMELEELKHSMDRRIVHLKAKKDKLSKILINMRYQREHHENELLESWKEQIERMKYEKQDTVNHLVQQQQLYTATQIEQNGLRLSTIKKLAQDICSLKAMLVEKKQVLEHYKDLQPDMVLSSFKVQEAEEQMNKLQIKREDILAEIAKSVH
ncbi:hypothetical protein BDF14DRAFT_1880714 [Spinellus fusiger]|nr:hypothetical protein BDF14DRAFT_1880714 [Spinellus fusiger]